MFAEKTMEASAITGTGSYQLGTSVGAFKTWRSQFATLSPVFYCAENGDGTIWEIGYGTLTYGTPDTISRTVLASSTGGTISWAVADAPIYVFSAPLATWMKHLSQGGRATTRPAWLTRGGGWLDESDAGAWTTTRAIDYLYNGTANVERGRHEASASIYVPSARNLWVDKGAANYTITAHDVGKVLVFDTTAAARTLTLIAGASFGHGATLWFLGYGGTNNGVVLTPSGSEAIDAGANGVSLTVAPNRLTRVSWDGAKSRWRTDHYLGGVAGTLWGLEGSTAGASTTLSVSVGRATDSTHVSMMILGSALAKTTGSWAAGTANGGLDTGTIANNTWYHWYLISKGNSSAVDVVFSTSASAPTLPATYTLYRRIFSWKTNGSGQWETVFQNGDHFYRAWVADFTAGGTSSMTLRTLSIPTGIVVRPLLAAYTQAVNNASSILQAAPAANSAITMQLGYTYMGVSGAGASSLSFGEGPPSNTSGQIYVAVPAYVSTTVLYSQGWVDSRGRNS